MGRPVPAWLGDGHLARRTWPHLVLAALGYAPCSGEWLIFGAFVEWAGAP